MKHYLMEENALVLINELADSIPVKAGEDEKGNLLCKILMDGSISVKGLEKFTKDFEHNISGPEDYTVDGNTAYLLNTDINTVFCISEGILSLQINLSPTKALKIASSSDKLYVLSRDLEIIEIAHANDGVRLINLDGVPQDGAIINFSVIGRFAYLTVSHSDSTKTYKISLEESNPAKVVDSVEGYFYDGSTYYKSELLPESGSSVGHSCNLRIYNPDGTESHIKITSDHYVIGVQYLGLYDGNYIIKLVEMSSDSHVSAIEETIRLINSNGETIFVQALDEQFKHIPNQVKVIDKKIYFLHMLEDEIKIENIEFDFKENVNEFQSCLSVPTPISEEQPVTNHERTVTAMAYSPISRQKIMENAKMYHDFAWGCSGKNLEAMPHWEKPSFVKGAGSYKCMPYCWGGFSSIEQYNSGMQCGGRVGNMDCTGAYISNTFGLDCSGFVSRAWELPSKLGTSGFSSVSYSISKAELRPGDALNKPGSHIILFEKFLPDGTYALYEATALNNYDRVSYTIRSAQSLSSYQAIRYKYVVE